MTQTPGYLVLLRYLFRFRIPLTEDFYLRIILPRFSFGRTGRDEYGVYDLFWPNSAYIEKNSNDIYIADGYHDRILIFSKYGVYLRMISEGLSRPHKMCILGDYIVLNQSESHSVTFHS